MRQICRGSMWVFGSVLLISQSLMAGTFRVNSSNWNNSRDGVLTLPEAALIAGSGITCLTQSERNQISNCNIIVHLPDPNCSYNPFNETRYRLDPVNTNCGLLDADSIVFDNSVTQINPSSSLELWTDDGIDGLLGSGAVVRLTGPGPSGWIGPALTLAAPPVNTGGAFRNLQITGFRGDGIELVGTDGAIFEGLEIYNNTGHGIMLGESGLGASQIKNTSIGSGDGSRPNYIYDNGGFGIRIVDEFNDGLDRSNRIRSSYIGFKNGNFAIDSGNGQGGIELINLPGGRVGGFNEGSRLYVGWNNGPGIRLVGTNSKFVSVSGVTVGLSPTGAATPNNTGIDLDQGAHDNYIGLVGELVRNIISGNTNQAIRLLSNNDANRIELNIIGMTPDLLTVRSNGHDNISIQSNSDQTTIRENVIVGAARWGVFASAGTGMTIRDNAIGLRGTGTSSNARVATPNQLGGVWLENMANATVGLYNVISGNGGPGLQVTGAASNGLAIHGNVIGLDGIGLPLPNNGDGVRISGGSDQIDIGTGTAENRNIISANTGQGIDIDGDSTDVAIIGNYIGVDTAGTADQGNGGNGIQLRNGVDHSLVQGNVSSGNSADGIKLSGAVDNVQMFGNIIGLNAFKTAAVNNGLSGIAMVDGANSNRVGSGSTADANIIAGNNTGVFVSGTGSTGNVINTNQIGYEGTSALPLTIGNSGAGVFIGAGANSTVVANNALILNGLAGIDLNVADQCEIRANRIGLGLVPFLNTVHGNGRGIRLLGGASGNVIGGANAATDRNIIAGSSLYGIGLFNAGTNNNIILNNWVGVGLFGSGDFGNGTEGILIQETASNNSITANVVSGNQGDGVRIRHAGTTGNSTQRNFIGTDSAGTGQVPNGGAGVHIDSSASGNLIGFLSGQGNTIRFNSGDGIWIESGTDNGVSLNAVDTNGGLAIDLGADGVTANDAVPDADTGANNLQNFPVLSSVSRGGGMVSFTATLNSAGNKTYGLQVFRNITCDPSGNGELETVLGSSTLVTPAGGSVSSSFMMPLADNIPASFLTAVVNDDDNSSEVSACASLGTLGDVLFRNSFEDPARVAETNSKLRAETWELTRLDAERVRLSWVQPARIGAEQRAHVWRIAGEQAVRVDQIAATGADCRLAGVLECQVPDGTAPVAIELIFAGPAAHYMGLVLQRSGRAPMRHWIAP